MGYYSTTKRNKVLIPATTCMNLQNIMLVSEVRNKRSYIIPFILNVQKVNEWLPRDRKDGRCEGEGQMVQGFFRNDEIRDNSAYFYTLNR